MPLLTIVEHYIWAALQRAMVEDQGNGVSAAYVHEIPGIIAFGTNRHALAHDLQNQIEEWITYNLESGIEMPEINGINLNSERGRILATYHDAVGSVTVEGPQYANEDELDAAFAAHGEIA